MRHAIAAGIIALFTMVGSGTAFAQEQDGLVNVNVGDVITLEDLEVVFAARVAATICGMEVGPVVALSEAVDRGEGDQTICEIEQPGGYFVPVAIFD